VKGFKESQLLKREAAIFRLDAPGGEHAVAIVVSASLFPGDFDFSPTYTIAGEVTLEVRFLPVPGGEEYCILVSPNPKAFEAKALIF
jgi:hypothetical protein